MTFQTTVDLIPNIQEAQDKVKIPKQISDADR